MTAAELTAGVDEAGRGCLAGPVAVAAVILSPDHSWDFVDDSKKLTAGAREEMALEIRRHASAFRIEMIDVQTIDQINILQATMLGMKRSVEGLTLQPQQVLVDGNRTPDLNLPCRAVVGGDASIKCIGAASILAKTARDQLMIDLDQQYPGYDFYRHKGYGTAAHLAALDRLGPTAAHRRSFAPVRKLVQAEFQL